MRSRRSYTPSARVTTHAAARSWIAAATSNRLNHEGDSNHEARHHRRHWTHRIEARDQAAGAKPRRGGSGAQHRRQHSHRGRTRRGASGRRGRRGRVELSIVRGRCGHAVLHHLDPQSDRGRQGRRCDALRGAVGGRHRAALREWLLPRQGGAGAADQGVGNPVLDRARDAVLRVHQEHRGCGDRREHRYGSRRSSSSRWRPTTSPRPSAESPWERR